MAAEVKTETMKPSTLEEYAEWTKETLGFDFNDAANRNRYNANLTNVVNHIASSEFLNGFESSIAVWAEEYIKATGSDLFIGDTRLTIAKKPYPSVIDKTFRKNVLWNNRFPSPPEGGWYTLDNIYTRLNDLGRACLVCKFIDGPDFVGKKLNEYCTNLGLDNRYYSQEREEGYYAYHSYTKFEVDIIDKDWQAIKSPILFEIQFTTQLQEVLNSLTHQYFEDRRLEPFDKDKKWKWDYKSNRFKAGYMSHTLHLLEAIIVDLRDNSRSYTHTEKEI